MRDENSTLAASLQSLSAKAPSILIGSFVPELIAASTYSSVPYLTGAQLCLLDSLLVSATGSSIGVSSLSESSGIILVYPCQC